MTINDKFWGKRREEPASYIRQCGWCGNFHNWRLFGSGRAMCLNCGRMHGPIDKDIEQCRDAAAGRNGT